jgi:hypothetical protein
MKGRFLRDWSNAEELYWTILINCWVCREDSLMKMNPSDQQLESSSLHSLLHTQQLASFSSLLCGREFTNLRRSSPSINDFQTLRRLTQRNFSEERSIGGNRCWEGNYRRISSPRTMISAMMRFVVSFRLQGPNALSTKKRVYERDFWGVLISFGVLPFGLKRLTPKISEEKGKGDACRSTRKTLRISSSIHHNFWEFLFSMNRWRCS